MGLLFENRDNSMTTASCQHPASAGDLNNCTDLQRQARWDGCTHLFARIKANGCHELRTHLRLESGDGENCPGGVRRGPHKLAGEDCAQETGDQDSTYRE